MELDDYRKMAMKAGLPLQFVIKEFYMFEVLSNLADKLNFPLVGGTAINRIYLNELGRFSEDLDFEVYGKTKISLPDIPEFKLSGPFVYRRNIRFEYAYSSPLGKDKIRIDINMKPRVDIKTERKTLRFASSAVVSGVETFSLEGLVARKILALARRMEGKDIYDLWMARNMLDLELLKKEISAIMKIEKIHESQKDFLKRAASRVSESSASELAKMNPYIPADRRLDWKLATADVSMFLESLA